MRKSLTFILIVFSSLAGIAQQEPDFTLYRFNNLYYNPGYAGIKGAPTFSAIFGKQWLGWEATLDPGGSPTTFLASADIPLVRYKGGVGIVALSDRLGPQRNMALQVSASKHFNLGPGKLGLGLRATYNSLQFEESWRPPDGQASIDLDESIPKGDNASQGLVDMGAGLWYEHSKFYVGLSSTRMLNQTYKFTLDEVLGGHRRHFYLTGGYNIEVGYDLVITPMAMIKSTFSEKGTQFELGAIAKFQERYRGGLNFRQGESIAMILGADLLSDKSLMVNYALDFTIVGTGSKALTSHEVMIAKRLPPPKIRLKPPIRTPRYRF